MLDKIIKALNFKTVSKKNLPFFFGWIIVFIWLYSYFLPFGQFRFESNLYNEKSAISPIFFTATWLISCPLITIFFNGRKYVSKTYVSAVISFCCFIAMRLIDIKAITVVLFFIASVCIGHIFASSCYAFFIILNNTEKFYAMILSVFIPKLFLVLKPVLNHPGDKIDGCTVIIGILLAALIWCTYNNRNSANDIITEKDVKPPRGAYSLMLLVFVVLSLNDVIAPAGLRLASKMAGIKVEEWYFAGIFLGILFIIICQGFLKLELYNAINISFAFISVGFITCMLSLEIRVFGVISLVFFGLSYSVGFVNIYYLAGVMAKKFMNINFFRTGIALSSVYYVIAVFVTNLLDNVNDRTTVILMSFLSVSILIIFFVLSPFFMKNLGSGEWMDDSYRIDVTHEDRINTRLRELKLSPREIETCRKLMEGYTLRQIAAIMNISYPTVNTYCNSIYKKLSINSRTELLVLLQKYNNS